MPADSQSTASKNRKIDGEELLIMKESDVMGVIEEGVAKKRAA
jgi:co-chaperonin GroES (HSP10)